MIRASSLPLAFACAGSIHPAPGELQIQQSNEGAALGSAVHEVLAQMVTDGELPDVRPSALKWGCDVDELGRLSRFGAQAWREIQHAFPNPLTEQELTAGELSGHIDLLSLRLSDGRANIADWKSGYKQSDYYHQVMAYATLVMENFPDVQAVFLTIIWLRDREVETFRATREGVAEWNGELQRKVLKWDGVSYSAGEHCQWCPRFATCPARHALVKSAVEEATGGGLASVMHADYPVDIRPAFVAFYTSGKFQLAKQLLKRLDDLIRAEIEVRGPLDLGNGRELALVAEPRDTIDPLKGWPVFLQYLTQEQLAPAVKIGKTALLDAVGATVAKGKGKIKEQIMSELKAVDAVAKKDIFKLRERPIVKEIAK